MAETKLTPRQQAALFYLSCNVRHNLDRDEDWRPVSYIASGIERWHRIWLEDPTTGAMANRWYVHSWNVWPTAKALVDRGLAEQRTGLQVRYGVPGAAYYHITKAGVCWLAKHEIQRWQDLPAPNYKSRGGILGVDGGK